jgi:hypothetical protein
LVQPPWKVSRVFWRLPQYIMAARALDVQVAGSPSGTGPPSSPRSSIS